MGKEPTPKQFSSRLAYNAQTPAFLRKLQNKVAGIPDSEEDPDEEEGWEQLDPNRPAIPVRPSGDSDDKWKRKGEDDGNVRGEDEDEDFDDDERPVVVVLKEGKHLTVEQAENEKRIAKGLPPLPRNSDAAEPSESSTSASKLRKTKESNPLSFSTKSQSTTEKKTSKRKAIGDVDDEEMKKETANKRKKRKESKGLLSFGDGLE